LALGCTVDELLGRVTSRELTEWMAYERLEPFGEWRADLRAALVAMVMANAWRGKDQKAFTIEDFMLKFDGEPKRDQTVEDQLRMFELLTGALSG
jgi:hypothetical protein